MPKSKKRLKPRLLIEAERDAYDLVSLVLSEVLHARTREVYSPQHFSAVLRGRDPHREVRAAIARGARRALAAEVRARIPLGEAFERYAAAHAKARTPTDLHAALAPTQSVRAWALNRMDDLVDPPPLFGDGDDTPSANSLPERKAAESVAAELGDKPNAEQIRSSWRRSRKR